MCGILKLMAHAFVLEGDRAQSIEHTRAHAREVLGIDTHPHPDFMVFEYGLFSVDDARAVALFASTAPVAGEHKMIVIAATRIFHEAQNALLKLFEEPPQAVTMALVVPSLGQLLPTLRSRVQVLATGVAEVSPAAVFLNLTQDEREKYSSKVVDRTKGDKEDDKQAARGEILSLVEDLIRVAYQAREKAAGGAHHELTAYLRDLETFLPILHERSAPLKLIMEHLLLVTPRSLAHS